MTVSAIFAGIALFVGLSLWLFRRKNRKLGKLKEQLRQIDATAKANEDAKAARMRQRQSDAGGVPDDGDKFRRD